MARFGGKGTNKKRNINNFNNKRAMFAIFLAVSAAIVVITGFTPEEWKDIFNNVEE